MGGMLMLAGKQTGQLTEWGVGSEVSWMDYHEHLHLKAQYCRRMVIRWIFLQKLFKKARCSI